MRNWTEEMKLEENMDTEEIERFLKIINKSGIPSIEEYADGLNRIDVQEEYWDRYGDTIRAARDKATE